MKDVPIAGVATPVDTPILHHWADVSTTDPRFAI
jgi:hypothetical protein